MPIWRRTPTGSTPGPYRSLPSSSRLPSTRAPGITSCMRLIERRNVDLPQPDGPISAVTVCGRIVMFTPSTARNEP